IVKHDWSGAHKAEVILLIIDSTTGTTENDEMIIKSISKEEVPCYVALNKVDKIKKDKLFNMAEKLAEFNVFKEIFMISAQTGERVDVLTDILFDSMPEGEWQFSEDEMTDAPMKFIAQEFTREQIFLLLDKELPYNMAVETDKWEVDENGKTIIYQTIYVIKDSQKAIVLGKGGSMIKKIGMNSRKNIQKLLDGPVHLQLFIKIKENWVEIPDLCL
ncbi:MAG: GTPase Era, partial [Alphaproteobacteria bacterium]|nr:GTPase Era [Alphaproteobacteria bacterium]